MTLEQNKNDVKKRKFSKPDGKGEFCRDRHATSTLRVKEHAGRLIWQGIGTVTRVWTAYPLHKMGRVKSIKIHNTLHSYYDRSLPVTMAESNPTPAVDCDDSSEKEEEFVMLRVSTDQKTCWPTYLITNRTARRDGDERPTTMTGADILKKAEEKLKDVATDEDPFWFYTRSTTTRDEDRAPSIFSTALADKEEGEESLSQRSETSSPTSEPSSTESNDEGETASCATHSPVQSPCPSLSAESAESENKNNLAEQTVYPNDPIVDGEDHAWNPTPQWGTEYNWTQEYRDNEKRIADEWAVAVVARERERGDEAMSGGVSPPRKDATSKKKFLDEINDPHG
jgi:hypothetical protein